MSWRVARRRPPNRDVVHAKIVLLAAEGLENKTMASRLDVPVQIVCKWRKRFFEEHRELC